MKQTKIEILKYYVCDQEGKIKTFNRSRELIDTYVNYIEDKGYVALGLEYKIKDSRVVKSTDLVRRDKEYMGLYKRQRRANKKFKWV